MIVNEPIRVYNKGAEPVPADAVYIGRPSKFGNPFVLGPHGSREEVIDKFAEFLHMTPELLKAVKTELRGRSLVCWCAPKACHGDVLLRVANEL